MAGAGRGGLNRRTLIGGAVGAGLVATAGGILLPRGSHHAPPKPSGNRIRAAAIALSTADTLDPAKGSNSSDYIRHFMLYNCLTELDPALKAIPSLATAMETADQTIWHIRLRNGVTFHDGKPCTSADVIYSLLRHKKVETASKMATIAEQFADIRADGPLGIVMTLTGPNADLPIILSQSHFAIIPDGETAFRKGVGTGPFQLVEFRPSVRTLVRKNGHYWKPGRPYLSEIELIGIPDEVSRVNALLSGDIHMALALNPRSTKRVNASPGHITRETKSGLYTNLIMRQDHSPTSNPHLVQALKYLMDRPLMKRAVYRDYAMIGNDQPIPPFHPYYRADLPQTVLDLDKAKWHLRQSGLGNIHLPVFASPAAEGSVDMASAANDPILSTVTVRPEKNSTWEAGLKTSWFDKQLTFNIDAFYTRVMDFQANVVDNAAVIALRSYLANIPKVTVKGIEFDAAARIGSHLTLRAAGAYSDGKYASYPNGPCPIELTGSGTTSCNLSGNGLPGLPKWSGTAGGQYELPVRLGSIDGNVFLTTDVSTKTRVLGDATGSAYTIIKGYTLVNASLGYRTPHWEVALFARNLFNQDYMQNLAVQAGNSGLIVGTPSEPRLIGVTLRLHQ